MSSVGLVHSTTVPESLGFFNGLVGYMKTTEIEVHAVSSLGKDLWRFGQQEGPTVHRLEISRCISPARDLIAVSQPCIAVRRIRPRVMRTHPPKGGLLGTVAAWFAHVPIRVHAHSWHAPYHCKRPGALAAKIHEVAGDPERMARMSARNLAKAGEYRDDALRKRRLAFYRCVREKTETWIRASRKGHHPVD